MWQCHYTSNQCHYTSKIISRPLSLLGWWKWYTHAEINIWKFWIHVSACCEPQGRGFHWGFWKEEFYRMIFSKASGNIFFLGIPKGTLLLGVGNVQCPCESTPTGWRRPTGCLESQVIFRKRATNYRAFLRGMTYKDNASYTSIHYSVRYPRDFPLWCTRNSTRTWKYMCVFCTNMW